MSTGHIPYPSARHRRAMPMTVQRPVVVVIVGSVAARCHRPNLRQLGGPPKPMQVRGCIWRLAATCLALPAMPHLRFFFIYRSMPTAEHRGAFAPRTMAICRLSNRPSLRDGWPVEAVPAVGPRRQRARSVSLRRAAGRQGRWEVTGGTARLVLPAA